MNCIIVDDEQLAHDVILEYSSRIPFLNIVAQCYDIQEAINALKQFDVDLIILDNNLPDIMGIDFLKTFRKLPHVIFSTAREDYALESFELDVVDYLLKPYSFERFLKAVGKSYNLLTREAKTIVNELSDSRQEKFIFLRTNNEDVKVNLNEIIRISALKDYIIVYMKDRKYIVHQTMKSISDKLQHPKFIRVHNSHIISLNFLETVGKRSLMINGERIPISDTYRPILTDLIEKYK